MPTSTTSRVPRRDAEATRRRILDAAIAEFAQHGIAGARVDRIAAAASCNKAMIYAYYGHKSGLFDAVFDAIVVQTLHDAPLDTDDLPEYAARLFDGHRSHPEYLRIAAWDRLERGGAGQSSTAVIVATREKVSKIRAAQAAGTVSDLIRAPELLEMILTLSRSQPDAAVAGASQAAHKRRRAAVKTAVAQLTRT